MKLKELFSILVLYRSNFENLHWNAKGKNFDNGHKDISTGFYEMINDSIDSVAEMLARIEINPPNYKEVMDTIEHMEGNYLLVESQELYDREDIIKLSDTMLRDIMNALLAVLESEEMKVPINVGIKATIESMVNDYDIQYRYINKRKLD